MSGKKQHYIPRLHLRHFTGDSPRGQVWTYDAQNDTVRSSLPEETGLEQYFYSFENADGTLNHAFDDYITEVECISAPIYEKLARGVILDSQDKYDFAYFMALMYFRTPAMRRNLAELRSQMLQVQTYAYGIHDGAFASLISGFEAAEGRTFSTEEKEKLKQDFINPSDYTFLIPKQDTFPDLDLVEKLGNILYDMRWTLFTPKHGYFITSDNPIHRYVDPSTVSPFYGDHGFLNKTALVTFPISPKVMLVAGWRNTYPSIGLCGADHVIACNKNRAVSSERFLYSHVSDRRIQRLANAFKDSRIGTRIQGFGPDEFAKTEVPRRWSKAKERP